MHLGGDLSSVAAGDVVAACLEASWMGSSLRPHLRCGKLQIRLVVYGCGESLLINLLAFFCSLPKSTDHYMEPARHGVRGVRTFQPRVAFNCHIMDPFSILGDGHLALEFERSTAIASAKRRVGCERELPD
ncbi:hypothetical protein Bca52824_074036 [Brassica carinata]|uniref:Uncharacterized protein n=1 Tax=Brassica carinata TaxID=52824 RepID=A0A8X7U5T6_BRACI|nr:hypothetical protein Bca52824_074036 [Brassica carinata]